MASGLDAQRLRQQLEQVDRGAVGDEHLAGLSADHFGDLVPDARRSLDPVGVVPTTDEPAAPFLADHLGYAWEGLARQGAERVAIEIDHAFREGELAAQCGKRVLPIEGQAGLAVHAAIIPPWRGLEVAGTPGRPVRREHRVGTGDRSRTQLIDAPGFEQRAKPIAAKKERGEISGIEREVRCADARFALGAIRTANQLVLPIVPGTERVTD